MVLEKYVGSLKKSTFFLYLGYLFLLVLAQITYSKSDLHLFINQYHSPFFDSFFKYFTYLGDGLLFAIIIVPIFFIKRKEALRYFFAAVYTALLVAFFKRVIFSNSPRPVEFFKNELQLYLIDGVKMAHWNSFPSGHTTTGFAIFILIAFNSKKTSIQILCLLTAILVGFSRVYLSQHFVNDVLWGAILGFIIAVLSQKTFSLQK